jgi:hypothetical protein
MGTNRVARVLGITAAIGVMLGLTAVPASAAASPVQIVRIQYDSPGTDNGSNASLNGEYVQIKNVTSKSLRLDRWTLRDRQGFIFTMPANVSLAPGGLLAIRTGKGTKTVTSQYWGRSSYVWNNTGDAATLRNSVNATIDSCSWGSTGPGYTKC